MKIPDNCMSWFDGCNTCTMKEILEPQENGNAEHPRVRYEVDTCTYFMCSPVAMQEASCLEWRQCMVDVDEYNQLQESTLEEKAENEKRPE